MPPSTSTVIGPAAAAFSCSTLACGWPTGAARPCTLIRAAVSGRAAAIAPDTSAGSVVTARTAVAMATWSRPSAIARSRA